MDNKWAKNFPVIEKAIKENGLKIDHVARKSGLTYRQLYGRLTLEIDFELPVMRKISEILCMSMDELFNDKKICS